MKLISRNAIKHELPKGQEKPAFRPNPLPGDEMEVIASLPTYAVPVRYITSDPAIAIQAPCGSIVAHKARKQEPHAWYRMHDANLALDWINNPQCRLVRLVASETEKVDRITDELIEVIRPAIAAYVAGKVSKEQPSQ